MKLFLCLTDVLFVLCLSVSSAEAATYSVMSVADSGAGSLRRQTILDAEASAGTDEISLAVLVVNTTADTNDNSCDALGTGAGNKDCTLREAVQAAAPGDTITFQLNDAGCVGGVCTIQLESGLPNINKDLIIAGTGANSLTIKRNPAAAPFRIFAVLRNTNATISNLTVSGGSDGDFGGGGVVNVGNLNLTSVVISGNSATNSKGGGGIRNSGTLVLRDSTVSENFGDYGGGGAYNSGGTLTILNSTLSGNTGTSGAGVYNNSGTINVINSTVSGNTASFDCGGIYVENSSSITLANATVTKNASQGVGGVCNNGSTVNLRNTIVAGNTSANAGTPDLSGSITSHGYNLIGNSNGSNFAANAGDQIGTAQNPINPQLGELADNGGATKTHALLPGSPAVDKGGNALAADQSGDALTTDQRGAGYPRVADGSGDGQAIVDAGAFEYQSAPPTAATVFVGGRVLTADGRGVPGALVTLTDSNGATRAARANPFGYYRFTDAAAGATYVLEARHKRFEFAPQVLSATEQNNNLNFVAAP